MRHFALAVLILAGCARAQTTRWEIDFGDVDPASVALMQLSIAEIRGDTIDFDPYEEQIYRGEDPVQDIERLPPGTYLFSASAFGDDCAQIAEAGAEHELPIPAGESIVISLVPAGGFSLCDDDAEVCDGRGRCIAGDGGM